MQRAGHTLASTAHFRTVLSHKHPTQLYPAATPIAFVSTMTEHRQKSTTARTFLRGAELLDDPVWNKGTAFTREERKNFGITGYLPYQVHTLEQQQARAYDQFKSKPDDIGKNTFLTSLRDQNQVLYYSLLHKHIEEMMPIIYTPTEGKAIANYSRLFRRPEGLFLAYPNRDTMEQDLLDYTHEEGRTNEEVDLIIVSDGEQILGIGDHGVGGGVGISTAKAAVYTVSGGINPARTLAVGLDVGTNNRKLLDDDLYVGWRHERLRGEEYDAFVDTFANLVKKHFPNALLHFEDFGLNNALRLLQKYRPKQSVFNDDIQGTAAVSLAAILSACRATKTKLTDHRFVIHGAGTAGIGIAGQVRSAIQQLSDKMGEEEAAKLFWLVDKDGLIHEGLTSNREAHKPYVRKNAELQKWELAEAGNVDGERKISLTEVVKNVKPTVLIGVSTQAGAFTEEIIKAMSEGCDHPIILPLSNPTKLAECQPKDAFNWSGDKAILATGSPFPPVKRTDEKGDYIVAECNNALVYPGLSLGVIVSKAERLTDQMIVAGINAVSKLSPASQKEDPGAPILPPFVDSRDVSLKVASAVALQALKENLSREEHLTGKNAEEVERYVQDRMWIPEYVDLEYLPREKREESDL